MRTLGQNFSIAALSLTTAMFGAGCGKVAQEMKQTGATTNNIENVQSPKAGAGKVTQETLPHVPSREVSHEAHVKPELRGGMVSLIERKNDTSKALWGAY